MQPKVATFIAPHPDAEPKPTEPPAPELLDDLPPEACLPPPLVPQCAFAPHIEVSDIAYAMFGAFAIGGLTAAALTYSFSKSKSVPCQSLDLPTSPCGFRLGDAPAR